MTELIQTLSSQLGVNTEQAEGGLGAIAQLAQEQLGDTDFSALAGQLPGLTDMLGKAPSGDAASSGLGGMVGSALGGIMGGSAGNMANLVASFSQLGLDADMVTKFAPIVMEYAQKNGGEIAQNLLKKLF